MMEYQSSHNLKDETPRPYSLALAIADENKRHKGAYLPNFSSPLVRRTMMNMSCLPTF